MPARVATGSPVGGSFFIVAFSVFSPQGLAANRVCMLPSTSGRQAQQQPPKQDLICKTPAGSATHKHSAQEIATGSLRFAVQGRIGSCAGRKQKKKQKTANRCENHESVRCRNLLSESLPSDGVVEGCSLSLRLSPSEPETSTCSTRLG